MTQPKDALEKLQTPVVANITALVSQFPQIRTWDPFPTLCPGEICSALSDNGRPLFFDGDHLSTFGNARLYPSFRDVVLQTMSAGNKAAVP